VLDEFLSREIERGNLGPELFSDSPGRILLHGHCHQKSLASMDASVLSLSLPRNYSVQVIPSGCCGMAGSFGYEREHYDTAMRAGELVLFPAVRNQKEDVLIAAAGTSCRHQIQDGTGVVPLHPAQILRAALRAN
jgi:Fe-S oxidoreductase